MFIIWTFNPIGNLIDYQINKAEYIENCINKEVTEINCAGCCQIYNQTSNSEPIFSLNFVFSYGFLILNKEFDIVHNVQKLTYYCQSNQSENIFNISINPPPPKY